jgi:hypothetical protein
LSDEKYFVVAEEYACDGVWFSHVVAKGPYKSCCEYADLINLGPSDQYKNAEVMSEEEYEAET